MLVGARRIMKLTGERLRGRRWLLFPPSALGVFVLLLGSLQLGMFWVNLSPPPRLPLFQQQTLNLGADSSQTFAPISSEFVRCSQGGICGSLPSDPRSGPGPQDPGNVTPTRPPFTPKGGNDDLANARFIELSSGEFEDKTDISENTTEKNEPTPFTCTPTIAKTAWYFFKVPDTVREDRWINVRVTPESFDSVLALYMVTGSEADFREANAFESLSPETCGSMSVPAAQVSPGTYYLQVGAKDGIGGNIAFSFTELPIDHPANDNVSEADTVRGTGKYPANTINTSSATTEEGEKSPACVESIVKTVWYKYLPTEDETLSADTFGTLWDVVVSIWRGADLQSLQRVRREEATPQYCTRNQSGTGGSSLNFEAEKGVTYYFQVGGNGKAEEVNNSGSLMFHVFGNFS